MLETTLRLRDAIRSSGATNTVSQPEDRSSKTRRSSSSIGKARGSAPALRASARYPR